MRLGWREKAEIQKIFLEEVVTEKTDQRLSRS
jgi:hypothetical protein